MRRAAALALALLLVGASASADVVVPARGKPLHGTVRRDGRRVVVNPYFATAPEMTWGVVTLDAAAVREIRPDEGRGALLAHLDGLGEGDVAGWEVALRRARDAAAKEEAAWVAGQLLRRRPQHAEALELVGGPAAWSELRRGQADLDPAWARALGRVLLMDSAWDRRDAAQALEGVFSVSVTSSLVEALARSWRAPRGPRHDVALPPGASRLGRTTYSMYVPPDLHPLEARPLVVGLHGGLRGQGREAIFVGTARDVFELLVGEAERRRWILACPNAPEAPWDPDRTSRLLDALIAEIGALYPVDLSRGYLVGQGNGADAAFAIASRRPKVFAAVGGAAARNPALARTAAARVGGVWLHHGEADEETPVDAARKTAEHLRRRRMEFAYLELPGVGAGLSAVAEADLYRFLVRHARDVRPRSSLAVPATRALEEAWREVVPGEAPVGELLTRLRRGAVDAEAVARGLVKVALPVADVAAILADRDVPPPGRAWAAWLLGERGDPAGIPALGDAVRAEADPEIRRRAVRALRRLGPAEASGDLLQALEDVAQEAGGGGLRASEGFASHHARLTLAADVVEAVAVAGVGEDVVASIEEGLVIGVLKRAEPVPHRPEFGEDPSVVRARLAQAIGRAYRTLDAEATLMDLLRVVLRRRPRLLRAAEEGYAEGVPGRPDVEPKRSASD